MKNWIYKDAAKASGVVLLVINIAMAISGHTLISIMAKYNFFSEPLYVIRMYGGIDYLIDKTYNIRYLIVALTVIAAIISIAIFIYLMCTAG